MTNEEKRFYDFDFQASTTDYSPAALRSAGVK